MFAKLFRDERGQALIMISIMIPVMLGFVGLAIEGGRFMMMHSQLQDLADAAALAGAQKLTRESGSIAAARAAVNNTWAFKNTPRLSNDETSSIASQIASVHVCADISSDPCTDTTVDADARYVQVITIQRGIIPAFLVAVGATSTNNTTATATAESISVACNVQPLMLCNPYEPNEFNPAVGTLFGFTQQGNGTAPGDFQLLDPSGQSHSTATQIRNLLSKASPNFCYVDEVSPRPGQLAQDVANGINVRFDMQPQGSDQLAGLDQTPAPNVIKGIIPNITGNGSCSWNGAGVTTIPNGALPGDTDTAYIPNTVLYAGTQIDMSAANAYWNYHHGSNWPTGLSRYQAYQMERGINGYTAPPWVNGTENPAPQCAPSNVRNTGDDSRRIVSVAIVNCREQEAKGNNPPKVQTTRYADFFLTDPVAASGSGSGVIWAEFVRIMTPDSDGSKLKQIVQLVRDQ
jgi:Flp pilus assembly protein TadG